MIGWMNEEIKRWRRERAALDLNATHLLYDKYSSTHVYIHIFYAREVHLVDIGQYKTPKSESFSLGPRKYDKHLENRQLPRY